MVKEKSELINKLNYKDIIIILGLWYLMAILHLILKEITFQSFLLSELFHFLFILSGRLIYLAVVIFYLTYFYPVGFPELGFNFSYLKQQLLTGLSLLIFLFSIVLLLVNIPLSYSMPEKFSPLFYLLTPEDFIRSLLPLFLIFLTCIIISLSEQFLLNKIIYELFHFTIFNRFMARLLAALVYSVLIFDFSPPRIMINLLIASIAIILYLRYNSLLASALFMGGYYALYIVYIYGWDLLKY